MIEPYRPGLNPEEKSYALDNWFKDDNQKITYDDSWILWFEDADMSPIVFTSCGATEAALKTYEKMNVTWNCHLFRKVNPSILKRKL